MTASCKFGTVTITLGARPTHASYNSKTVTMNKSQNYSGVSLFYIINTTLDVTCEGGEGFTICVE